MTQDFSGLERDGELVQPESLQCIFCGEGFVPKSNSVSYWQGPRGAGWACERCHRLLKNAGLARNIEPPRDPWILRKGPWLIGFLVAIAIFCYAMAAITALRHK